jgi:soluble lytic murein transglycosylase
VKRAAFWTTIESFANAVGLMQLILPTARLTARRFRIKVDRAALRRPAINIKLGTSYLGFLRRVHRGVLPLIIASYNAGDGAVKRWLRRYRGLSLDEFVERIPYRETRRYTKRVLATLFAYTVLYGRAEAPTVGLALRK